MKLPRLLAVPAFLWFFSFILIPLGIVLAVSLAHRGIYGGIEWRFTFENYLRVFNFEDLWIVTESVRLALLTALSCLFIGLLCAWAMATAPEKMRTILLGLIALPFLTNLIIRVYSVKSVVGAEGPLNFWLHYFGVDYDPFALTANSALVWYGMVSSYLPFAVLPLYGAFEKFDFTLIEAAQDLGAGSWKIFWTVVIPSLRRSIAGAFILVFVPCLGEYVIPDLLGGARTMLFGNLITEQFLKARDWPFGSALAITMMLLLLVALSIQYFWSRRSS